MTAKQPQSHSHLLVKGFVARTMLLADGSRQIVAFHVPGDFIDLHSFLLTGVEHDLETLTPATLALFPHERLRRLAQNHAHLARLFWLMTLIDAAIHREWILNIGRRRAPARLAHLFCELRVRLEIVGHADRTSYALPLTQIDLSDATGLTPVHVNRVLRDLRNEGVVEFRSGEVRIHDLPRLEKLAEFDPYYLHVRIKPR